MIDMNNNEVSEDLFVPLSKRSSKEVFFYRIPGFNDEISKIIDRYYAAVRKKGAILTGKLKNPDENQVAYFLQILGSEFRLDRSFLEESLGKWIAQLSSNRRTVLANELYDTLVDFRSLGKNEAMIKNLYVRLMCWIYYKLGSIITHIGDDDAPKILYGGAIGRHELCLLRLLHKCNCDVVFLQYCGENEYNALDPKGTMSKRISLPDMGAYPEDFDIKSIEAAEVQRKKREQFYIGEAAVMAGTNIWLKGDNILEDLRTIPVSRGDDKRVFYNSLVRVEGVWDKLSYQNDLYTFYTEMKNSGRRIVLLEKRIPMPTNSELEGVERGSFKTKEQVVTALLRSVRLPVNEDLKKIFARAYVDVIFEEAERPGMTMQRLTTLAACVSCWLNRYGPSLFNSWTMPIVSLLIYLGGCRSAHEAAFLRVLSRLPCDVLILTPNLNEKCLLEDPKLFELKYTDSVNLTEYPTEMSAVQIGTVAYHAERELDSALYEGTGLYRDYQYKKASSVVLKTMLEEIDILWNQEMKFRPNFTVVNGVVSVPVIFAKVSGVRDAQPNKYWKWVQSLLTDNTFLIQSAPFIDRRNFNPMGVNSAALIKDGKLRRDYVISLREYQYRYLRKETQDLIFDKIDLLMSSRLISGTFKNGTEYIIASTLLNLPPDILKLIQGFDFTKFNPKVIYINTRETSISLEDAVLTAFLSLIGFDVLFLVPTGYQTVEGYFEKNILDEHKVGEYMYDLQVPKLKMPKTSVQKSKPKFGGLFRKGQ